MTTSATSISSGSQRRVAVLGAGLVARPLVEYLSRDARHVVTVVSALESEVRNLETMRANVNGRVVNIGTDKDAMSRLVQENDLVVSVLPATMHVHSVRARSARIILVSISHVIQFLTLFISVISLKSQESHSDAHSDADSIVTKTRTPNTGTHRKGMYRTW
jgi:saccharopine dehydrogenase-like NADP-dependent oxidoreductase